MGFWNAKMLNAHQKCTIFRFFFIALSIWEVSLAMKILCLPFIFIIFFYISNTVQVTIFYPHFEIHLNYCSRRFRHFKSWNNLFQSLTDCTIRVSLIKRNFKWKLSLQRIYSSVTFYLYVSWVACHRIIFTYLLIGYL